MRRILGFNAAAILLALLSSGCGTSDSSKSVRRGAVHHVVLCWLNEPGNSRHIENIIEQTRRFSSYPGVASIAAGTSLESSRPVVDDSFDVGLVMTFESREALTAYLDDPEHQRATEEILRPLVAKLVIYDILEDR